MSAGPSGQVAPVASVAGAIARMEAIQAATPADDGLACFNRMYLQVTRQVDSELGQQFFADPVFMTRLDVVFANLYFDAAEIAGVDGTAGVDRVAQVAEVAGAADAAGSTGAPDTMTSPVAVPLAWRPLVEQRADKSIEPIQFALAGMNAHINHDLPLAVVSTCTDLGCSPAAGTHLADYQKVDRLLDAAEQSVRRSFESAPELAVDRHLHAVGNLVATWSINSARDLAWRNALLLWALRDEPVARGLFLDGLATQVALASRLLLVAV